jgi:hypothetical protein
MLKLILVALIAFSIGIWGSDGVISTYRLFFGDWPNITCLPSNGICIGDRLDQKRVGGVYTLDQIGGLSALFCEDVNPKHIEEELLFVDEIIKGERCEGQVEGFVFRNSTTITVVIVEDGTVTKIKRGPLHVIDL